MSIKNSGSLVPPEGQPNTITESRFMSEDLDERKKRLIQIMIEILSKEKI